MTNNEIIKYLEQAIDKYNKNEIFVDNIRLDKLSLDIIKRQQVEIEKYKNNCEKCGAKTRECIESLHNIIAEQQAEIKELNTIRSRLIYDSGTLTKISDELYQKIKAEAVKEFAEQLKETITNAIDTYYNSNGGGYYLAEDTIEDIDSLLKKW